MAQQVDNKLQTLTLNFDSEMMKRCVEYYAREVMFDICIGETFKVTSVSHNTVNGKFEITGRYVIDKDDKS